MNKIYKILFPLSLLIGLGLLLFEQTKGVGIVFLTFFQPLILLYYLTFFKRSLGDGKEHLKLRSPLIILLTLTITLLPINVLFKTLHWPFAYLFLLLSYATGFITLIIAIAYFYLNRLVINKRFAYELVILIIPVVALGMNVGTVNSVNKEDYKDDIHKSYQSISRIKTKLYNNRVNKDSQVDSLVNALEENKETLIVYTGGLSESGTVRGWMDKSTPEIWIKRSGKVDSLMKSELISEDLKEELREAKTVIEYLMVFTEIQADLLIKERE